MNSTPKTAQNAFDELKRFLFPHLPTSVLQQKVFLLFEPLYFELGLRRPYPLPKEQRGDDHVILTVAVPTALEDLKMRNADVPTNIAFFNASEPLEKRLWMNYDAYGKALGHLFSDSSRKHFYQDIDENFKGKRAIHLPHCLEVFAKLEELFIATARDGIVNADFLWTALREKIHLAMPDTLVRNAVYENLVQEVWLSMTTILRHFLEFTIAGDVENAQKFERLVALMQFTVPLYRVDCDKKSVFIILTSS